jgi:DNA polymerase III alpha subunit
MSDSEEKYAIRFGLGAIKAVGFNMMENAIKERENDGKFSDIYDFSQRLDPRSINKKSIEALAKSGSFDCFQKERRQLAESFEILSSYSAMKSEELSSNQMSLFGGLPEADKKPELKKVEAWSKKERLQKEFEAFGYFLNEHPLDDSISDLKKRGVIFSDKLERDELEDGNLVKMSGVVAGSKHRSGPRGRFAYMTISDPFGIFEAMIFDEALITSARDILADGSAIVLECLIRKDDGGTRILIRDVKKIEEFIANNKAQEEDFEDIKKQAVRNYNRDRDSKNAKTNEKKAEEKVEEIKIEKKSPVRIEITISSSEPIQIIKSTLSQCLAQDNAEKICKVFFNILANQKVAKIELPQKYSPTDLDIIRLKNISGLEKVEVFF